MRIPFYQIIFNSLSISKLEIDTQELSSSKEFNSVFIF